MTEVDRFDPMVEARCTGCPAAEVVSELNERAGEPDSAGAAMFFKMAFETARDLISKDPSLIRKHNELAQAMDKWGPESEFKDLEFGDLTLGNIGQAAASCAIKQATGGCRLINQKSN